MITSQPGYEAPSKFDGSQIAPRSGPEVSIIIVNWNSTNFVRRCLQSLFTYCRGTVPQIVVVDAGSFDGCGEMLAREFPTVVFVQSPENIGFARANNLGARHASGRYLLFLNPDTELVEDSIRILHDRAESLPDAGTLGCRLLNSDRTLQTSCVQSFPTVLNQVLDSDFLRDCFPRSRLWGIAALYSPGSEPAEVEVVSGACIFVKRELFDRVGGFTEHYFMYGEDLDLCFKVRREGYRAYYVPDTSIIHYGSGSTGLSTSNFSDVMVRESVYRFMRMNRGAAWAACYRIAIALASLLRLLVIVPTLVFWRSRTVTQRMRALKKWFAILRWSLGLESWVHHNPSCMAGTIMKQALVR